MREQVNDNEPRAGNELRGGKEEDGKWMNAEC